MDQGFSEDLNEIDPDLQHYAQVLQHFDSVIALLEDSPSVLNRFYMGIESLLGTLHPMSDRDEPADEISELVPEIVSEEAVEIIDDHCPPDDEPVDEALIEQLLADSPEPLGSPKSSVSDEMSSSVNSDSLPIGSTFVTVDSQSADPLGDAVGVASDEYLVYLTPTDVYEEGSTCCCLTECIFPLDENTFQLIVQSASAKHPLVWSTMSYREFSRFHDSEILGYKCYQGREQLVLVPQWKNVLARDHQSEGSEVVVDHEDSSFFFEIPENYGYMPVDVQAEFFSGAPEPVVDTYPLDGDDNDNNN